MEIDPSNLPDDPATLKRMVASLLDDRDAGERRLRQLQHMLEQLLRYRYGPRRERVNENQLFLFAAEIIKADKATSPEKKTRSTKPQGKGHGRQRLPKTLERRRVVFDLAENEKQCKHCERVLELIGEEVSERLEYIPASMQVIEEVCLKYACHKGCMIVTAQKPMAPIEKGLPGPGLLAQVAVSKYGDHLPLNRQEGIFQRHGVTLSRKTMCDWMWRCAELVSPLYDSMKERVLSSKVVQTDDTPVKVLDPSIPHTRTGRIWTYVGDCDHPYTVYDYTPTRGRDGPDVFMEKFHGYLQADAYTGYDELYKDRERRIVEVACWAHVRRKHFEAQSSDPMRSTVMLAYIRLLYDVEREAREMKLGGEERKAWRQAKSAPILDDIKAYLQREQLAVLPKSPEGGAMAYTLSNWEALIRYCDDGDLEIDNNGAERSLRGIAVGRRNWTFFGSDNGGQTAAILTSMTASCKRLAIDPFTYLRDIFQRISSHPKNRFDELLPDKWKAARSAATAN
ncbi:MAG: IS66 family transposase [Acidobacteriia bacterium]|nr:IS66 family transposase [Terriglobia bacterium]